MAICQLCLKEKKLIKAHIFPNFIYKYIYDDKHDLQAISFEKSTIEDNINIKGNTVYTGVYDGKILCPECDNGIIGKFETVGSKILLDIYNYFGLEKTIRKNKDPFQIKTRLKNIRNTYYSLSQKYIYKDRERYTQFNNVDYDMFKKFLLSILFKIAISKGEFSKHINILNHKETLRKILFFKQDISEMTYPIVIQSFIHHIGIQKRGILAPISIKEDTNWCIKFFIPGLLITIFMKLNSYDHKEFSKYILKKNGRIKIMHMKKDDIRRYLIDFMNFKI